MKKLTKISDIKFLNAATVGVKIDIKHLQKVRVKAHVENYVSI